MAWQGGRSARRNETATNGIGFAVQGLFNEILGTGRARLELMNKLFKMEKGKVIAERQDECLFSQAWWFDAACPGEWDTTELIRDNVTLASLSYHKHKKFGFTYLTMPPMARTLEPVIEARMEKAVSRFQHKSKVLRELIDILPRYDRLELCLPPESDLTLPFVLAGFGNTATFTYRMHPGHGESAWQQMDKKTRYYIKLAMNTYEVEHHADLDRYERLSRRMRMERDTMRYALLRRIFDACLKRGQATILTVCGDVPGQDLASAILVWDANCLYYWVCSRSIETASRGPAIHGVNALLIWKAYEMAMEKGLIFDMDGFIARTDGYFKGEFGFHPFQRNYVTWGSPLWSAIFGVKSAFSRDIGFVDYR